MQRGCTFPAAPAVPLAGIDTILLTWKNKEREQLPAPLKRIPVGGY
jgi:hypothetical protein